MKFNIFFFCSNDTKLIFFNEDLAPLRASMQANGIGMADCIRNSVLFREGKGVSEIIFDNVYGPRFETHTHIYLNFCYFCDMRSSFTDFFDQNWTLV